MQFVDSVQLRYGVASDGTSRDVTHYATAAEVDALPGTLDERWARVVNLRLCVVMRSQGVDEIIGGRAGADADQCPLRHLGQYVFDGCLGNGGFQFILCHGVFYGGGSAILRFCRGGAA